MMNDLESAITYCEEVAEEQEEQYRSCPIPPTVCDGERCCVDDSEGCKKCASDHRQFAEWLTKLKEYEELFNRPHGRIIDESQITKFWYREEYVEAVNIKHCYKIIDHTDAPTILEARRDD